MSISQKQLIRAVAGFVIYLFGVPVLLFIAAGTLAWPGAWVYVGLLLVASIGGRVVVYFRNPDTLLERAKFYDAGGTPDGERLLVGLVGIVLPALSAITAGLDHRFRWTPEFPAWVLIIGGILLLIGYGAGVWAMVVNRFFSAVVRIQSDRDQYVVESGPYRIVRHPSYAGAVLASVGLPLLLNSAWLLVAMVLYTFVLVLRTRTEDKMLLGELPGYREYAARTRSRLIPGVW
ncbi:MAG: isoprenylcysteine carboxylmethyltransferase family protein [Anaerolineales bacterium]|jgi:protein-S-isoprenylcysteine O-methyltransferase Ste14